MGEAEFASGMALDVNSFMTLYRALLGLIISVLATTAGAASACSDMLVEARTSVGARTFRQFGQGLVFRARGRNYIVTPAHVIQGAQALTVRCEQGTAVQAQEFRSTVLGDLAILTVKESAGLRPLFNLDRDESTCESDQKGFVFDVRLHYLRPEASAVKREEQALPYGLFVPRHLNQPLVGYKQGLLLGNMAVRPGWSGARVSDERGRFCGLIVKSSRRYAYSYGITGAEVRQSLRELLAGREPVPGVEGLSLFVLNEKQDRLSRVRVLKSGKEFFAETQSSSEFSPVSAWSLEAETNNAGPQIKILASEADQLNWVSEVLRQKTHGAPTIFAGKGSGDWGDGGGDLAHADSDHRIFQRAGDAGVFSAATSSYLVGEESSSASQGLLTRTGRRLIGLRAIPDETLRELAQASLKKVLNSGGHEDFFPSPRHYIAYTAGVRFYSIDQIYQMRMDFGSRFNEVLERFAIYEDQNNAISAYCAQITPPKQVFSFNQGGGRASMEMMRTSTGSKIVMSGTLPMGSTGDNIETPDWPKTRPYQFDQPNWMGISCKLKRDTLSMRLYAVPYVEILEDVPFGPANYFFALDADIRDQDIAGEIQVGDCRHSLKGAPRKGWLTSITNEDFALSLQVNEDGRRPLAAQFFRVAPRCFESLLKRHPSLKNKNFEASQIWLRRFEWTYSY